MARHPFGARATARDRRDSFVKLFRTLACSLTMAAANFAHAANSTETVVLLHGLACPHWMLTRLALSLERDGYRVVNLSYPSRTLPIETIAAEWLPARLREARIKEAPRVHFVTHSMGGIVLRQWLATSPAPENLGHVVMIAPPNAGSEVTDRLKTFLPFRWFTGVNGRRLGTDAADLPCKLGAWPVRAGTLGIIAGDRSLNPLFSSWLAGPDDGKVSVARTRLDGMSDFIVLHHSHTWLTWRADTLAQLRHFLVHGQFTRVAAA